MQEAFRIQPLPGFIRGSAAGNVIARWHNSLTGTFLAVSNNLDSAGNKSTVRLLTKSGSVVREFSFDSFVVDMDWCSDESILAVLQESGKVFLYNKHTQKEQTIESGWKGCKMLKWAPSGQVLAVGTAKGNVLIINKSVGKKIPILGKHSRGIVAMEWTADNLLVLAADDKSYSISSENGDPLFQGAVSGEVSLIQYYERVTTDSAVKRVIVIVVGRSKVFIHHVDNPKSPVEFSMNSKYGNVISCEWCGSDNLVVGFSNGTIICLSTLKSPGKELFNVRDTTEKLELLSLNSDNGSIATVSSAGLKIRDIADPKAVNSIVAFDDALVQLAWARDASLLAAVASNGVVHILYDQVPLIYSSYGHKLACLTSLSTVSIYDLKNDTHSDSSIQLWPENEKLEVSLNMEPQFVTVNDNYLAVASHSEVTI
eukprot:Partr_v1_DN28798_c1_g1_i1_m61947 putative WD repeat domain 19